MLKVKNHLLFMLTWQDICLLSFTPLTSDMINETSSILKFQVLHAKFNKLALSPAIVVSILSLQSINLREPVLVMLLSTVDDTNATRFDRI